MDHLFIYLFDFPKFFLILCVVDSLLSQSGIQPRAALFRSISQVTVCLSVNRPLNQSIDQSINQSTTQSINRPVNQSIDHSINQTTSQSINQSSQSVKSINQANQSSQSIN
eukprot:Selendium_serpulae@DN5308_c0_g1_i1.p4